MSNEQQPAVIPFSEELGFILGRPNFWCSRYAELLRCEGIDIPRKAESEQAAVIHWMLNLFLKHGDTWRTVAEVESARMYEILRGSNEN